MKKRVLILGSTGSVGENAVRVARALSDRIQVVGIAANSRLDRIAGQAAELGCSFAATGNAALLDALQSKLPSGCKAFAGMEAIADLTRREDVDLVLCAIVGSQALPAVLAAAEAGKTLALATKEVLVMAGDLVMKTIREKRVTLVPVDSEHSAVFQCLRSRPGTDYSRVILTASGGPFRNRTPEELEQVTWQDALKHPTWNMGPKVTIDSATLMNKALEMLEAHHLFGTGPSRIAAIVHPQSIVHSMVEFTDHSVMAQLSVPDMRFPIQYAMTFPETVPGGLPALDLAKTPPLTFEPATPERFPALGLAYEAIRRGGVSGSVMNASNEVAVRRFHDGEIRFPEIIRLNRAVMEQFSSWKGETLAELLEADRLARIRAEEYRA